MGIKIEYPKKTRYRGVPPKVRKRIWERCDGICEGPMARVDDETVILHTCQNPAMELAHLRHRGIGGSRLLDIDANLAYVCKSCHDIFDRRVYED